MHNAKILLETLSIYGHYTYFIPLEGRNYLHSSKFSLNVRSKGQFN